MLKVYLLAFHKGWKIRQVMKLKQVVNAITQCKEYVLFLEEMEQDPKVSEVTKKQFSANLPRSKT